MPVNWSLLASADLAAIHAYLAPRNPVAARRLLHKLHDAGESLADLPMRGRPGLVPGTREWAIVWPFVIVYEVDPTTITILRIWHGARQRS